MKISKRTLCAAIALMFALLSFGCYAGITSAKVEDAYMTEVIDSEGVPGAAVTSFPADAEILYAAAKLLNTPDNTQVHVVWTYVTGDQQVAQVNIDSGTEANRYIYSSLTPSILLPEGDYKVEFFIEDREEADATATFYVTAAQAYLEDAHMTSYMDAGGVPVDTITEVAPTGTWYVSAILRNATDDTIIRYIWYDTNGAVIDEYTFDPEGESDIYIGGTLTLTQVAPVGTYHVDLYIDGESEPEASVSFTVNDVSESSAGSVTGSFSTYVQSDGGYQVDYPTDWILLEYSDSYSILIYPLDYEIPNEDDMNGVIIGVSQGSAYGYTTETALEQWISETEDEGNENYTYIDSNIDTVNGNEMAMFAYSWSRSGYDLYTFDFLVVQNSDLYVISCTMTYDASADLYPYLEQIVLSFQLL